VRPKVRIPQLLAAKGKRKLSALTCYDASFARILDKTSLDIVLVGDSLGHVIQGLQSTIPVTVEDICYHTRAVARALSIPHLVSDMPFGTVGLDDSSCFEAAKQLMQAGAEGIKIEGASPEIIHQITRLVRQGIPVMGHLGLTPQSLHALGGYRIQGKSSEAIAALNKAASALEAAGCYAIVLELCSPEAGQSITSALAIPTIGIGSGSACDGQILVLQDMLGMNSSFKPKFLKHFESLEERILLAASTYITEVETGTFPEGATQK
jgi:3-methyl-2-oxobutanoate hydroxymethyltransferase